MPIVMFTYGYNFCFRMSYAHPAYHGGKNHPEQVTDEYLCSGRRYLPPPPNPVPINRLAQVPREVFIPTQTDRLLRRHNKARGRDDTLYHINDYNKPCGPTGCGNPNTINMDGYNGMCGGHYGSSRDPCSSVMACTTNVRSDPCNSNRC